MFIINMKAYLKWIQHFVIIFIAIKTSLYVKVNSYNPIKSLTIFRIKHFHIKRHWRTEYHVEPISVEPGLGPVKNPDNTYNVLNQVTAEIISSGIHHVSFTEECQLPSVPGPVW